MTNDLRVRHAVFPQDDADLTKLCWAYRASLADLGKTVVSIIERFYPAATYGALIDALPQIHARPKGSILLIENSEKVIGCGMIHPLNDADAEIKRVYISGDAQGLGAGKVLSTALIDQARSDQYSRILLDTTRVSTPARRLYETLGFEERGPYSEMPPDVLDAFVFYQLKL